MFMQSSRCANSPGLIVKRHASQMFRKNVRWVLALGWSCVLLKSTLYRFTSVMHVNNVKLFLGGGNGVILWPQEFIAGFSIVDGIFEENVVTLFSSRGVVGCRNIAWLR